MRKHKLKLLVQLGCFQQQQYHQLITYVCFKVHLRNGSVCSKIQSERAKVQDMWRLKHANASLQKQLASLQMPILQQNVRRCVSLTTQISGNEHKSDLDLLPLHKD